MRDFGKPDFIHDNGLWRRHNHAIASLAKSLDVPRVVSTRGMLEPWARNHKKLKKRIAWQLYQRRDLARASRIHTTSAGEAANVVSLRLGVPVEVIPNGVDIPALDAHSPREKKIAGCRRALVLGRYHPIKGLPMLVDAWARVRPPKWQLEIAGPDEAGHRAVVEALVKKNNLEEVVTLSGAVQGREKDALFREADLFILPSYSESFGMSAAEALSYGVPVLTTTGAPWPMLEEKGCGWLCAPTAEALAERLSDATSSEDIVLQAMGKRSRDFVIDEFSWKKIAEDFSRLYAEAVGESGAG